MTRPTVKCVLSSAGCWKPPVPKVQILLPTSTKLFPSQSFLLHRDLKGASRHELLPRLLLLRRWAPWPLHYVGVAEAAWTGTWVMWAPSCSQTWKKPGPLNHRQFNLWRWRGVLLRKPQSQASQIWGESKTGLISALVCLCHGLWA